MDSNMKHYFYKHYTYLLLLSSNLLWCYDQVSLFFYFNLLDCFYFPPIFLIFINLFFFFFRGGGGVMGHSLCCIFFPQRNKDLMLVKYGKNKVFGSHKKIVTINKGYPSHLKWWISLVQMCCICKFLSIRLRRI